MFNSTLRQAQGEGIPLAELVEALRWTEPPLDQLGERVALWTIQQKLSLLASNSRHPAINAQRPEDDIGAIKHPHQTESDIGNRPQTQVIGLAQDFSGVPASCDDGGHPGIGFGQQVAPHSFPGKPDGSAEEGRVGRGNGCVTHAHNILP